MPRLPVGYRTVFNYRNSRNWRPLGVAGVWPAPACLLGLSPATDWRCAGEGFRWVAGSGFIIHQWVCTSTHLWVILCGRNSWMPLP